MQAINRCFYSSTIEEIMENLKKENTPFALACLQQMNKNSMLSMKLALRMVR
jgi:chaperone required for assembly of F1-ATPase